MKFIISFTLFISCNIFALPKVEFSTSKVHSLFVFVDSLVDGTPNLGHLKLIFSQSSYNTEKSKLEIEKYKKLENVFRRNFIRENIPSGRKNNVEVKDILLTQSIHSKNLKDFKERSKGIFTIAEEQEFFEVLNYFNPIYENLIWNKNEQTFKESIQKFRNNSKKWGIDDLFIKAKHFYKSQWPDNENFMISFFPIPSGTKYSSAKNLEGIESVGLILNNEDIERKFGVIMHEISHSLFHTQSIQEQEAFTKFFIENKSNNKKHIMFLFDEVLATAIGNGLAYQKTKKEETSQSWYADKYIDSFAKAIFSTVKEYFDLNKEIDNDFMEKIIKKFDKTFPNADKDLKFNFEELTVYASGSYGKSNQIRRALRESFDIYNLSISSPFNIDEIKKTFLETHETLLLIGNKEELQSLGNELVELIDLTKKLDGNFNQFGLFLINNKKIAILILKQETSISFVLKQLKKIGEVKKLNTFEEIN